MLGELVGEVLKVDVLVEVNVVDGRSSRNSDRSGDVVSWQQGDSSSGQGAGMSMVAEISLVRTAGRSPTGAVHNRFPHCHTCRMRRLMVGRSTDRLVAT
jgi:hypothetical protein